VADVSGAIHGGAGVTDDELELVAELKARSIDAWAGVYNAHHERLYRYALARLGSREEAEDVASSVFMRALARIDSYRCNGKPLVAWLYGISQNVIRERRRKLQRQTEVQLQDGDDGGVALSSLSETGIREPFEALDLQRALKSLTAPQREVTTLMHIAGFTAKQVAHMLGKSPRSVYYLEARALTNLKQELLVDGNGEESKEWRAASSR
jgi:RNA polymerase sigma-70 factor (ECF subfamily)